MKTIMLIMLILTMLSSAYAYAADHDNGRPISDFMIDRTVSSMPIELIFQSVLYRTAAGGQVSMQLLDKASFTTGFSAPAAGALPIADAFAIAMHHLTSYYPATEDQLLDCDVEFGYLDNISETSAPCWQISFYDLEVHSCLYQIRIDPQQGSVLSVIGPDVY